MCSGSPLSPHDPTHLFVDIFWTPVVSRKPIDALTPLPYDSIAADAEPTATLDRPVVIGGGQGVLKIAQQVIVQLNALRGQVCAQPVE